MHRKSHYFLILVCLVSVACTGYLFYLSTPEPPVAKKEDLTSRWAPVCPVNSPADFKYHAQDNMDIELQALMFNCTKGDSLCGYGSFVDIGANDGWTYSNTLFFEQSLGWRGICVEPNPEIFDLLTRARPRCNNFNFGIASTPGIMKYMKVSGYAQMLSGWVDFMSPEHIRRIDQEVAQYGGSKEILDVKADTLVNVVNFAGFKKIDFLSIDVEGAEYEVVKSIDFTKVKVHVVVIEANIDEPEKNTKVIEYMKSFGFVEHALNRFNNMFINPNYQLEINTER